MYCPSCLAEYRPGFTHCPDCDIDLIAELPSGDEPVELPPTPDGAPHVGADAVEVYVAFRTIEAELLRSLLADAGIPAALFRSGLSAYAPEALGQTRVMVARDDAAAAIEVIRAAQQGDNSLTEFDEVEPGD